uniref:Uncharacterized protein n=1 Tax=Micrurus spixii TaxID=129469 RepID=A0A2D4NKS6_9SAUR
MLPMWGSRAYGKGMHNPRPETKSGTKPQSKTRMRPQTCCQGIPDGPSGGRGLSPPSQRGGGTTPDNSDQLPDSYDSNKGKNDPMVSGLVPTFIFPIWLTAPKNRNLGDFPSPNRFRLH